MRKYMYFASQRAWRWPAPEEIAPYFLAPKGQEWSYSGGNDSWGLRAEGLYETEALDFGKGRVDAELSMWGNGEHGVLLIYSKRGGGYRETFSSKGDMTRLHEFVRTLHDDPMPVGLYIPFREAWKAVKEFIETEGELPKSIDWIANKDLPPNTFPDP